MRILWVLSRFKKRNWKVKEKKNIFTNRQTRLVLSQSPRERESEKVTATATATAEPKTKTYSYLNVKMESQVPPPTRAVLELHVLHRLSYFIVREIKSYFYQERDSERERERDQSQNKEPDLISFLHKRESKQGREWEWGL